MSERHVIRPISRVLLSSLGALLGFVIGCHDPGVVGGECRDDRDCAEQCVKGNKFPDGTCTVSCRDDRDCPSFAACVEDEGGICLPMCEHDSECRDRYDCKDRDREGADGKIGVCIH